jgi:tetratricopeptide (TPR) repeat protein
LYSAEIYAYKGNYQRASQIFPLPIYFIQAWEVLPTFFSDYKDENYYKSQILVTSKKEENCSTLLQNFPSVENYFFCGDIFNNIGDVKNAKVYYRKGLQKLPDLWNRNSPYWNNFFISETITGNRFFSSRFSHIEQILDFLQIPREK